MTFQCMYDFHLWNTNILKNVGKSFRHFSNWDISQNIHKTARIINDRIRVKNPFKLNIKKNNCFVVQTNVLIFQMNTYNRFEHL